MTRQSDPIVDADIHAYIDNQLDMARRIAVEAHLAQTPELAARAMADLQVRDELRLALRLNSGSPDTLDAHKTRHTARLLEQALRNKGRVALLRRAAAVAVFVGFGWVAHSLINPFTATPVVASVPTPAFVREALQAHEATLVREKLRPTVTNTAFDAGEVRAATGIVLPKLPENWTVLDSQIFPSDFGPSVEMAVKQRNGRDLTLFAARTGAFSVQRVTLASSGKSAAAYWQIGEVAYALISDGGDTDALAASADRLAKTLY
ncbi:anti-sigma factor family protein [Rhizobium oryziradicis]|uniref:Fis family transcriptional regulator n=1 Tax=Rhizobium oryziradicis TaxID=1867956 RepID=A0A1Q8ZKB6_9HYPH|nr:anti-sigma factor [Rhizobium oryziradicis]OLP42334.1 Fis family transcriptional regulator [Rhizobium oryziradicis]